MGDVILFLKSDKEFKRDCQYRMVNTITVGKDGCIRVVEIEYQNFNEGVKWYTTRGSKRSYSNSPS